MLLHFSFVFEYAICFTQQTARYSVYRLHLRRETHLTILFRNVIIMIYTWENFRGH